MKSRSESTYINKDQKQDSSGIYGKKKKKKKEEKKQ